MFLRYTHSTAPGYVAVSWGLEINSHSPVTGDCGNSLGPVPLQPQAELGLSQDAYSNCQGIDSVNRLTTVRTSELCPDYSKRGWGHGW